MTHIAIQEAAGGKNVEWLEKLSDDDYLSPLGDTATHSHS